jgi:hypothetical protein
VAAVLVLGVTAAPAAPPGDEEFTGPFPSWRDVRRDYGAAGDGKADDTAALQSALDDLVKHQQACVLFVPAGTYRITRTLRTLRKTHTDCQGVSIVGEDPGRTVLRWDGPQGGTMVAWDAWYARFARLTLDGAGKAGTALLYGPAFSTYNETSDVVFRDAAAGLMFGAPATNGQAENEVLRCRFQRCGTGVQTVNWNSMDIWVWYCRFEDCDRGVHNVMGNWHVWQSLFLRSRIADLSTRNLMAFSAVNNTSVGSRCFFDFATGHTWGSPVSITGNRVFDPTGDWAVALDNAGPYLIVDNVLRIGGSTGGVCMTWGDQVLVGNTCTSGKSVEARGRYRRIDEKVVPPAEVPVVVPELPPTPPRRDRPVIEVAAGADGDALQRAIDQAARLAGRRPVVHVPMGACRVRRTIIVPRGSDVQLVGDGGAETATRLEWAGPDGGVLLRLEGPSRATLRDLYLHAPSGGALLVADAEQPGGRIFADQLNASGPGDQIAGRTAAIRVQGLRRTDVLLRALQGSGNGGAWVAVDGPGSVGVFTGATGSAAGQYDVRRGGRLVVRGVYHERSSDALTGLRLSGAGTLSIDATRFSYATSARAPTIAAQDFRGLFTLATCILLPVETRQTCRIELRGDGSAANVLALCDQFWVHEPGTTADTVWQNRAKPPARGGLVGCNINTSNRKVAAKGWAFLPNVGDHPDPARARYGSGPLEDRGGVDDGTIVRHLAPLRQTRVWLPAPAPAGATDVRIHRVMATGGRGATVEFHSGP